MMFFSDERVFFTPYQSPEAFFADCSYIITDPLTSLLSFTQNLAGFLMWSLPLTVGLISFNLPLLILLSFPIAMNLLTLNIPILIAMALFAAPALYSLSLAIYDVVDFILSPIVDIVRIVSNVGATAIENIECEGMFNFES